jgi:hypothetical protein
MGNPMKTKSIVNRYHFSAQETAELLDAAGSHEEALHLAITQAQERARLFINPCTWRAVFDPRDARKIIVTRSHAKPLPPPDRVVYVAQFNDGSFHVSFGNNRSYHNVTESSLKRLNLRHHTRATVHLTPYISVWLHFPSKVTK